MIRVEVFYRVNQEFERHAGPIVILAEEMVKIMLDCRQLEIDETTYLVENFKVVTSTGLTACSGTLKLNCKITVD